MQIKDGIAISIDICNSTKMFSEDDIKSLHIMDKLSKLVLYSLSGSRCMFVRHTGDGALLFYPEYPGFHSTDAAVDFAISFLNLWTKCTYWFSILKDIKIRVSLDSGTVYTNEDGGLWCGIPLNASSKIKIRGKGMEKYDENRVILSQRVYERLEKNNIYKKLFKKTAQIDIGAETLDLYNLKLEYMCENENLHHFNPESCTVNIALCIIAVNIKIEKLQCVIASIEAQVSKPREIIIATSRRNMEQCTSSLRLSFIDADTLDSKKRSHVRNQLVQRINIDSDQIEYICFLDGDTILSPEVFKIAYNVLTSNMDSVISINRLDFDLSLDNNSMINVTNMFLEESSEYFIPYDNFTYNKQTKNTPVAETSGTTALPSYVLFVPKGKVQLIGNWDENFKGWGEEDIDYTYRLFLKGCNLFVPKTTGFLSLHLSHGIDETQITYFLENAMYLLSKHPDIYGYRQNFYNLLGL